jgi:LPPG:FO 2-phospho-L-lactate transferase
VIAVLSGGVGAARLLRALRTATDAREVTAIVNVGDDLVMHGLTICPDLDTITYTLAGLNNEELGWGLAGETWRVMDELTAIGGEAWFRLGDRDLATHLYRSQRIGRGAAKSDVATEVARRLGVVERLLPVSDDELRTVLATPEGELSFQEYFVRRRHDVEVSAVRFVGADRARPAPGVLDAIRCARRIVIAPSNPLISIDPILAVPGVRDAVAARRDDVVAVSPIIGGRALKGPADRLLRELGHEASCVGVARHYLEIAGRIVIDEADAASAPAIERLGVRASVTTTVMGDAANDARLAKDVMA